MPCHWKTRVLSVLFLSHPVVTSLSPSKLQKARIKLQEFSKQRNPSVLIVDGNNLRGCQNEWSPWDCMNRIETLRKDYGIDHALVVWDHGPAKLIARHSPRCLALFAGPSQRADDCMVREARYIRDCLIGEEEAARYHNLCFVTNDNGLQQRLRKLGSDPKLRVQNKKGPLI